MKEPLFGIYANGKLIAVADIESPDHIPSLSHIITNFKTLGTFIRLSITAGIRSIFRAIQYDLAQSKHRPKKPHFYIVCVGVHPDYQGQGYGKKLIEYAHQLSEAHPTSGGTGLDTENPENVSVYKHLGFEVVETNPIHGLKMWTMFRSNSNAQ
jgi:ribosomal protein S18 acetylase RimI-like enzyme